jgi:hypothetical protein
MAESYGLNFNLAMTTNEDGVVDLGVHVTDSDGLDLDHKASGKDGMKVINEITSTLTRELMAVSNGRKQKKDKEKAEKLEKERAERATKLANLKEQAEKIKKQIADLEKDAKAAESVRTNRPSYESLLDQDFARLLKIFG